MKIERERSAQGQLIRESKGKKRETSNLYEAVYIIRSPFVQLAIDPCYEVFLCRTCIGISLIIQICFYFLALFHSDRSLFPDFRNFLFFFFCVFSLFSWPLQCFDFLLIICMIYSLDIIICRHFGIIICLSHLGFKSRDI